MNCCFWIFEDNLYSLFLILADIVEYNFNNWDLLAINHGLTLTSDISNIWFDYSLIGKIRLDIKICRDSEDYEIIYLDIKANSDYPSLAEKINLVSFIAQSFRLNKR